jgi:hypothetical protein
MAEHSPAPSLRIFHGEPSFDDRQRGHVTIPRWIQSLTEIPPTGKAVLVALIGGCRDNGRVCRMPFRKLAAMSGLKVRTVKYWIGRLTTLGFILRREDVERSGEAWETTLLFDPRGLDDTRPKTCPTPDNQLSHPRQPVVPPQTTSCPPHYRLSQTQLPFSENSESVSSSPLESNSETPPTPQSEGFPHAPYSQGVPVKTGSGCAAWYHAATEPIVLRNFNPPAPVEPDPEPDKSAEMVAAGWRSWLPKTEPAAEKKTGCEASRKSPPQPAGVQIHSINPVPLPDHTVKACPRQETRPKNGSGQRARQDSNLQPSDSKFAPCPTVPRLDCSAKTPDDEAPNQEDSIKTRGSSIRGFSRSTDLGTPLDPTSQPTGSKEDA